MKRLTQMIMPLSFRGDSALSSWMVEQIRDERRRQRERDEIDQQVAHLSALRGEQPAA
jgi:hypothetical protein